MDINSRIKWTPGMELNATTFSALDDNFDLRQLVSVRTANGLRIGRLPGAAFSAKGMFVRTMFEIDRLQCMALLASGMIVSIDERVAVPMRVTPTEYCYLAVGFGSGMTEYECNGQTLLKPTYDYRVLSLQEMEGRSVEGAESMFPIVRFRIVDGRVNVDGDFIAPCLIIASDERLTAYRDSVCRALKEIAEHPNMAEREGRRVLLNYVFKLGRYSERNTVEDFMQLLHRIALTIGYYIMAEGGRDDGSQTGIEAWSQYDVEQWLSWFAGYMDAARDAVERMEPLDNAIDYEALKAELRREVFGMVREDMEQRIAEAKAQIGEELQARLGEVLRDYIDGTLRQQLHDTLGTELTDELRQPLYDGLYQALYDALYIPPTQEEDNFMPLI